MSTAHFIFTLFLAAIVVRNNMRINRNFQLCEAAIEDLETANEDNEKAFTEALNDIREKLEDVQDEEQVSNMIDREVCREVERYMTEEYSQEGFGDRIEALESKVEAIVWTFRRIGNDLE
jgi:acetyl-CoA carboxylase alpha subunit